MKNIFLISMIALYIGAGINHFIHPAGYKRIMPSWFPWHYPLIYISGVCEILFALLLLHPASRRIGAWAIICLLVAVFPANIQMAFNYHHDNAPSLWLALLRLPLQLLLIWWSYQFTKLKADSKRN